MNIAHVQLPVEHPNNTDFVAGLDRLNQVVEWAGFVWCFVLERNRLIDANNPRYIVNRWVWENTESVADLPITTLNTGGRSSIRCVQKVGEDCVARRSRLKGRRIYIKSPLAAPRGGVEPAINDEGRDWLK